MRRHRRGGQGPVWWRGQGSQGRLGAEGHRGAGSLTAAAVHTMSSHPGHHRTGAHSPTTAPTARLTSSSSSPSSCCCRAPPRHFTLQVAHGSSSCAPPPPTPHLLSTSIHFSVPILATPQPHPPHPTPAPQAVCCSTWTRRPASTPAGCRRWCWTRPTASWTWASRPHWTPSWPICPGSDRRCCSGGGQRGREGRGGGGGRRGGGEEGEGKEREEREERGGRRGREGGGGERREGGGGGRHGAAEPANGGRRSR